MKIKITKINTLNGEKNGRLLQVLHSRVQHDY
jgi:hypothetical protein